MMEAVTIPTAEVVPFDHASWAVQGDAATKRNLVSSIYLEPTVLEQHNLKLDRKYRECQANEVRYEEYRTEDAQLVVVAYGIVSRIVYSTIDQARKQGLKVGMLRPITLWPFPTQQLSELAEKTAAFLAVELSTGQMIEDVHLAVCGRRPVHFYGRCGGMVPGGEELVDQYRSIMDGGQT
jgi:2-oxoglutarate ferredoxin oxidoreductase subunit alpha